MDFESIPLRHPLTFRKKRRFHARIRGCRTEGDKQRPSRARRGKTLRQYKNTQRLRTFSDMPVKKTKGGYKWGSKGKTYPSKKGAQKQAKAAYASGYKKSKR